MMENYKPNSNASKKEEAQATEERKKIEKVVSGTVKTKKKSGFRKFFGSLIADETTDIKTYIVRDVVVPAVKKAVSDTVDTILYGSSRGKKPGIYNKVSYRSYYDDPRGREQNTQKAPYSYDDIILANRGDAEAALSQMKDIIEAYRMVSVADLYEMVGIKGNYTDNNYGWTDLSTADVRRVRDGYRLELPRTEPLK